MPFHPIELRHYATLAEALQTRTAEALKPLAAVVSGQKGPTRKADLIAFIERQLEGAKLRAV